jgi:hypothetical protein
MYTSARPAVVPVVAGRDPFIDVLRVGAIIVVVLGHWIMPVLGRQHGTLVAGNALSTPGWWVLTWFVQVMPVFFVAGGAANVHSYLAEARRGGTAATWLAARLRRLGTPVLPLLGVWLLAPPVLRDIGIPGSAVALGSGVAGQLLWFLAVYLVMVAATPVMLACGRRWGLWVPVALGVAAFGVDMIRFGGLPLAGYANELLVWLAVQQLGIGYAEGWFDQVSPRGAVLLGVGGLTATALLVLCGPYPASMVGIPGQSASNMAPATVCLLTLGVGQLGVLLALRERLVRAGRSRLVAVVGARCMTIYLWHMSAMVVVAGIAVLGFGYVTPSPGSAAWFVATPLWILALGVTLLGLVLVFGRFEAVRARAAAGRPGLAFVPIVLGMLGIAAFGFADPLPALASSALLLAGLTLVWPGVRDRALGRLLDLFFTR